jgi:long-chain acyl-CoA synthetase
MLLYRWLTEAATTRGNAKALVYRDTYLSWRGLCHRVDRRAQEFAAMGIQSGSWVGLMLGNVPDFVILTLALSKVGAVVVPLDPTTGTRELEMILDAAPLRGLITRPRGGDLASPRPPTAAPPPPPKPRPSQSTPESRRRLQGTLLTCSTYRRHSNGEGTVKPCLVQFTTDAGGDPKGVLRTEENLCAAAESIAQSLDVKADDHILTTVPLFHAYGFDFGLLLAMRHGGTLFLEDEVSPNRVQKILREHSIDLLPATPTLYAALGRLPVAKGLKARGARFLAAGSAMSEVVAERFHTRYGVRVLSCYHTAETGPVTIDRRGLSPTSLGKPFEGVEVRVTNPDGARVPPDKRGRVWVRSDAVAAHAIGPRAMTAPKRVGVPVGAATPDGWFRTGDLGYLDRAGRLFLDGREDDLVQVEGKRIALGEVEGCLEAFPKVKAAQVRIVTDPLGGPIVVARVVPVGGKFNPEEIIDHCARNLAPYKVPRRIEFCERLPS